MALTCGGQIHEVFKLEICVCCHQSAIKKNFFIPIEFFPSIMARQIWERGYGKAFKDVIEFTAHALLVVELAAVELVIGSKFFFS